MLPAARPDLDKHIKILAVISCSSDKWRVGVTVTLHNRVLFTSTEVRHRRVELQCGVLTNP